MILQPNSPQAIDDDPVPSAAVFRFALDEAARHIRYALEDVGDAFTVMPANTQIGCGIDMVTAVGYLRTAQRLIAHAAEGVTR